MIGVPTLASEFGVTVANADVWLSIGLALLWGAACWVFGIWVARQVGLLARDAPAGETLGVGLACGLMVIAAWWAAIRSGGRSSFTPVAIGFAIAIALGLVRRVRPAPAVDPVAPDPLASDQLGARPLLLAAIGGAVFVVAVALLYGATIAPSPRDGTQPVEFTDEAFYSILGRDLATTGTESNLAPSGFSDIPGVPAQTWYHWGELWLASAVITLIGSAPLAARHFIVLPLVLLAAAALTGTIVRRIARTTSIRAYLLGFLACLFLAPIPFIPVPYFSGSNVGLIFGITTYGLAAVAVLLALYSLAVVSTREPTLALAGFVGSAVAFILPAHIAFAALAVVGAGTVWAVHSLGALRRTRRLPVVAPVWRRVLVVTAVALAGTVGWGLLTGHGQGGGGAPPAVSAFNATWREAIATTILGAGTFLAMAVAWRLSRREGGLQRDLYVGTAALLVAGAVLWGARMGEFTTFHAFYGGIAVFATPVAAVAIRALWERLREMRRAKLAATFVVLCIVQLEVGVVTGVLRLQTFGPIDYPATPVALFESIKELPPDAKLAYACHQFEEIGFATPRLLSIDAHTARRVVPMCYAAEVLSTVIGADPSLQVPSLYFQVAPQRALYPDAAAKPSSAAIAAFLRAHVIGYIYADEIHPNSLVDDAVVIAGDGPAKILEVP